MTLSINPFERRDVLLEIARVSLSFDGRPILRDVSAEIRDVVRPGTITGQVVALLGPSGIGKTQLFRVLAGLAAPDEGRVSIGPELVPVRAGMVGVVGQSSPLFEHRTVLDNLVVAARRAGLSRAEAKGAATKMLARFRLDGVGARYPAVLSGGERQRVAIAQQILASERFLLMDEPFSGLDPRALDETTALIREVAALDELRTIVVVTHDIATALEVADTVWLLGRDRGDDGRPVPGARIQEVIDLAALGLAWTTTDPSRDAARTDLVRSLRARFASL